MEISSTATLFLPFMKTAFINRYSLLVRYKNEKESYLYNFINHVSVSAFLHTHYLCNRSRVSDVFFVYKQSIVEKGLNLLSIVPTLAIHFLNCSGSKNKHQNS